MVVENLYKEDVNVKELILAEEPKDVIVSLQSYFSEISVAPSFESEETLKQRKRYLSERTAEILIACMEVFGSTYAKEVIELVANQEYTLHHAICEKFNLFQYLVNHAEVFKGLENKGFGRFLAFSYQNNDEKIYGKKAYESFGTHGIGYKGFLNDLYSRVSVKDEFGIRFRLDIGLRRYELKKLGKEFNVSEETMERLLEIERTTNFSGVRRSRVVMVGENLVTTEAEEEFENAFNLFVKEVQTSIQKQYPNVSVKPFAMFHTRDDVNTDYSIVVEKFVPFREVENGDSYKPLRNEMVNTIKMFNELEETHFGFEYMTEKASSFYKDARQQGKYLPLFS